MCINPYPHRICRVEGAYVNSLVLSTLAMMEQTGECPYKLTPRLLASLPPEKFVRFIRLAWRKP